MPGKIKQTRKLEVMASDLYVQDLVDLFKGLDPKTKISVHYSPAMDQREVDMLTLEVKI